MDIEIEKIGEKEVVEERVKSANKYEQEVHSSVIREEEREDSEGCVNEPS